MSGPHSPAGRPFLSLLTSAAAAGRWILTSTRRRRFAFYGTVIAFIVGTNTGLWAAVLRNVQLRDELVQQWDKTLRDNVAGFVLMLVIGVYFDLVVHHEDKDAADEEERRLSSAIAASAEAGAAKATASLVDAVASTVRAEVVSSVEATTKGTLEPLIREALAGPLSAVPPDECLRSALDKVLATHPESYGHIAQGILGHSPESLIDDATLRFTLSSMSDTDSYFAIRYAFRGVLRRDRYALVLARGTFNDESRLLSSAYVTDAWLFIDDEAYARTLGLLSEAQVTLRYRNEAGAVVTQRRHLVTVEDDVVATQRTLEADLSPPHDAVGVVEAEISTSVVLPVRPAGLRWIFDEPIYVNEVIFDVAGLWPGEEIDFTLYPFLLGTDDYTMRSETRQPTYRIGVRNWLHRGHGVILIWDRCGRPNESQAGP